MKSGRKGFSEELQIKERYASLTEPYFNFIKEMFETGDKKDKMWASEQLSKAYTKMIPQAIEGGNEQNPLIIKVVRHGGKDNQIA